MLLGQSFLLNLHWKPLKYMYAFIPVFFFIYKSLYGLKFCHVSEAYNQLYLK